MLLHQMMRRPFHFMTLVGALLAAVVSGAAADDSPRLQVTVNKKTIVRPASRSVSGDERGRVQTLAVTVVNQSIRALPEGSILWTAVVRKAYGGSYKYSGSGKLPPLISFRSAELQLGAFEVDTVQTGSAVQRDKIDHELIITHNGKETYRTTSVSNFAALAANAQPMSGQDGGPAAEAAAPAKPLAPVPASVEKMPPPKAPVPVADVAKPPGEPAPAEPPIPQQPFDFFNLGGKKGPVPK